VVSSVVSCCKRRTAGWQVSVRLHVAIQNEELSSRIFHSFLAEMVDQEGYGGWVALLVISCDGEGVSALVGEEHLEPTTKPCQSSVSPLSRALQYAVNAVIAAMAASATAGLRHDA